MHEYERYLAELGDSSHQGRNLSDAEQRRTIFLANRYRIHSHNSLFTAQNGHIPRHHFKLALNQMADWLPHEVNILFHTHFPRPSHPSRSQHSDKNPRSHSFEASQSSSRDVLENDVRNSVWPATLTPEQINWAAALNPRERSVVPEVKNQGICGSCWAFTAIASTEASIRLTHGIEPPSLSVQELVDCDVANNRGCYGGNPVLAYDYLMNKFVSSWADYPYTESKGECRRSGLQPRAKIDGFLMISSFDQEILKRFVASGPVSVGICGTDFVFMFYAGGVFDYRDCCITQNHAMLVVGYGEDSMTGLKYWLLQNSWGVQWGEKGFMRILRTDGPGPGVCGLATNPTMAMGGRLLLQSNKTHALAPQSELRSLFDSTNEWLQSHLGGFVLTLALALLACSVYILRRGRMAMLSSSPTISSSSANERSSLLHSGEIQRDYEAL